MLGVHLTLTCMAVIHSNFVDQELRRQIQSHSIFRFLRYPEPHGRTPHVDHTLHMSAGQPVSTRRPITSRAALL